MSKAEKTESKAAVDLIGAYFGKSGASWIMQVCMRVCVLRVHACVCAHAWCVCTCVFVRVRAHVWCLCVEFCARGCVCAYTSERVLVCTCASVVSPLLSHTCVGNHVSHGTVCAPLLCGAQALVLFTGSLVTAMPVMAMVHVAVGLAWINATMTLAGIMKVSGHNHRVGRRVCVQAYVRVCWGGGCFLHQHPDE